MFGVKHGGLAANFGQFGHFMGKGEGQEYAVQRFRDEVMSKVFTFIFI